MRELVQSGRISVRRAKAISQRKAVGTRLVSAKIVTEPDLEITITLPQSHATFVEATYEGDTLEQKIEKDLKDNAFQLLEAMDPEDWTRAFGSMMMRDYQASMKERA